MWSSYITASLYQSGSAALPGCRVTSVCGIDTRLAMSIPWAEDHNAQWGQRHIQGVRSPVDRQRGRRDAAHVSLAATPIQRSIAIQHFFPLAFERHSNTVILPGNRSEIANEKHHVARVLRFPNEADDAAFEIVAINPCEARGIEINFVKGRLPPV